MEYSRSGTALSGEAAVTATEKLLRAQLLHSRRNLCYRRTAGGPSSALMSSASRLAELRHQASHLHSSTSGLPVDMSQSMGGTNILKQEHYFCATVLPSPSKCHNFGGRQARPCQVSASPASRTIWSQGIVKAVCSQPWASPKLYEAIFHLHSQKHPESTSLASPSLTASSHVSKLYLPTTAFSWTLSIIGACLSLLWEAAALR